MAYRRRLKRCHHKILIYFYICFYNSICCYRTSIQNFMQFGAFFMFLLRLIFLEFPLSSAKVAGMTGGARIFLFFFYFPDLYRILRKVKKFHSKIASG